MVSCGSANESGRWKHLRCAGRLGGMRPIGRVSGARRSKSDFVLHCHAAPLRGSGACSNGTGRAFEYRNGEQSDDTLLAMNSHSWNLCVPASCRFGNVAKIVLQALWTLQLGPLVKSSATGTWPQGYPTGASAGYPTALYELLLLACYRSSGS